MAQFQADWVSFSCGLTVGFLGAFGVGFARKAGERACDALYQRLFPKSPGPLEVSDTFVPTKFRQDDCAWVAETDLYQYERKGYFHYPHPENGARCFRYVQRDGGPKKVFLVVRVGAKAVGGR